MLYMEHARDQPSWRGRALELVFEARVPVCGLAARQRCELAALLRRHVEGVALRVRVRVGVRARVRVSAALLRRHAEGIALRVRVRVEVTCLGFSPQPYSRNRASQEPARVASNRSRRIDWPSVGAR
jgi:hypothetical protein